MHDLRAVMTIVRSSVASPDNPKFFDIHAMLHILGGGVASCVCQLLTSFDSCWHLLILNRMLSMI